jgi:hypothetical protein
VTGIATATAAAALVWFWYGLPVLRRIQDPDDSPSDQR